MLKPYIAFVIIAVFGLCYAGGPRPGGHCPPRAHCRSYAPCLPHYRHYDMWGPGGRYFWPGFIGGVVGGIATSSMAGRETVVVQQPAPVVVQQPAPVVVQQPVVIQQSQPVVVQQSIWIDGHYVDQVQPNGAIIRVWQPGHYEQRAVIAK